MTTEFYADEADTNERDPQYQLDLAGLAGDPDKDARSYDDEGFLGTHDTNLFDQDEGRLGGQLMDESTGERIDNSTDAGLDGLTVIEVEADSYPTDTEYTDILPPLEHRDAAQVLIDHFGAKIVWVGNRFSTNGTEQDTSVDSADPGGTSNISGNQVA